MRHMRSGTSFVALSIIAALFVGVMLWLRQRQAPKPQSPQEAFKERFWIRKARSSSLLKLRSPTKIRDKSRSRKYRRRERITPVRCRPGHTSYASRRKDLRQSRKLLE